MTLQGFISAFSAVRTGQDNSTGRSWQVRDITFNVPYTAKSGKQREHVIIGSCFNKLRDEQLEEMKANKLLLEFNIEFSVHTYENKTFQDCRIYGITMPIMTDNID